MEAAGLNTLFAAFGPATLGLPALPETGAPAAQNGEGTPMADIPPFSELFGTLLATQPLPMAETTPALPKPATGATPPGLLIAPGPLEEASTAPDLPSLPTVPSQLQKPPGLPEAFTPTAMAAPLTEALPGPVSPDSRPSAPPAQAVTEVMTETMTEAVTQALSQAPQQDAGQPVQTVETGFSVEPKRETPDRANSPAAVTGEQNTDRPTGLAQDPAQDPAQHRTEAEALPAEGRRAESPATPETAPLGGTSASPATPGFGEMTPPQAMLEAPASQPLSLPAAAEPLAGSGFFVPAAPSPKQAENIAPAVSQAEPVTSPLPTGPDTAQALKTEAPRDMTAEALPSNVASRPETVTFRLPETPSLPEGFTPQDAPAGPKLPAEKLSPPSGAPGSFSLPAAPATGPVELTVQGPEPVAPERLQALETAVPVQTKSPWATAPAAVAAPAVAATPAGPARSATLFAQLRASDVGTTGVARDPGGETVAEPAVMAEMASSDSVLSTALPGALSPDLPVSSVSSPLSATPPPGTPVAEQVLEGTTQALQSGKKEITLQLAPEHLGAVRVRLSSNAEQQVRAHFVVATAEAHEALTTQLDELHRSLERQGVRIEQVSVVLAGDGAAKGSLNQFGQQQGNASPQDGWGNSASQNQDAHQQAGRNPEALFQQMAQQQYRQSGGNQPATTPQSAAGPVIPDDPAVPAPSTPSGDPLAGGRVSLLI